MNLRLPSRVHLHRALSGSAVASLLLVACGGGTEPAAGTAEDASGLATTAEATASEQAPTSDPATTSLDDLEAATTTASAAPTESGGGQYSASGPDGRYVVGDTYSDTEMLFTYEGLAAVPFDDQGEYAEGECYLVLGSVEVLPDVPRLADGGTIAFRPSFDPIFDGTPDEEQSNEFFNCDVDPAQELGHTQSGTTELAAGETAAVWLDAIYVSPDRVDTLDGFRLYGMDDATFAAEVTQDLTE